MNNMKLWNSVSRSDRKYIRKGYRGKDYLFSINPQYQKKIATQVFGPMGQGWGVKNQKVQFEDKFVLYTATLWYIYPGDLETDKSQGEFDIASEWNIGSDCVKAARTDAITKGLSELGFNADVFLGELDKSSNVGAVASQPQVSQDRVADEWQSQTIKYGKKYYNDTWENVAKTDLQYLKWMATKAEKITDNTRAKAKAMISLKPLEDLYGK